MLEWPVHVLSGIVRGFRVVWGRGLLGGHLVGAVGCSVAECPARRLMRCLRRLMCNRCPLRCLTIPLMVALRLLSHPRRSVARVSGNVRFRHVVLARLWHVVLAVFGLVCLGKCVSHWVFLILFLQFLKSHTILLSGGFIPTHFCKTSTCRNQSTNYNIFF